MDFKKCATGLLVLSSCLLVSCGTIIPESERILSTPLQVKDYNSVSSSYYNRARTVKAATMKNGDQRLYIEADCYDGQTTLILFQSERSSYTAAIDKYFEWCDLAGKRKEILNKNIAKIKTQGGTQSLQFVSTSPSNHYLDFGAHIYGAGHYSLLTFDKKNAKILRSLLVGMPYETSSLDSVYN